MTFDGGNGEVTGVGDSTIPPPSQDPSTPPSSSRRRATAVATAALRSPPPAGGACTATYSTTGSWGNGFQGQVNIRATTAMSNWMVHFNFPGTQTITQAWNGKHSAMGNMVMF